MKEQKKKKWIRTRHKIITFLGRPVMALYCRLRYGIKIDKFREQGNRPYLILLNHQTPFDQFFVGMSLMGKAVYYLATEDIFSNGWVSSITSGECLVCRFKGPGTVLIQTRNPEGFKDWINTLVPHTSAGSAVSGTSVNNNSSANGTADTANLVGDVIGGLFGRR